MAVMLNATVSFAKSAICVSEGEESRTTSYIGNSSVPHMLIHILALRNMGATIKLLDSIPQLEDKLSKMRVEIEEVGIEAVQQRLSKMSV